MESHVDGVVVTTDWLHGQERQHLICQIHRTGPRHTQQQLCALVLCRPPALLQRTAAGGDVVDGRLRPLCSRGGGLSGTGAAAAGAGADVTSTSGASASKRDAGQHSTSGRSGFSFGSKAKRPSPSSKAADSQVRLVA